MLVLKLCSPWVCQWRAGLDIIPVSRTPLCLFFTCFFPLQFDLIGNEGIIKAHIRHDEYLAKLCRDASVKHNKVIYKSCSIYDLSGFSLYLSSKEIEIFKSIAQMDGRYYPESLGKSCDDCLSLDGTPHLTTLSLTSIYCVCFQV
jgi:hypothetical protein